MASWLKQELARRAKGIVQEAAKVQSSGGDAFEDRMRSSRSLQGVCMSEVKAEEIDWHWANRIAGGKVHLLLGNPGVGKSFFTCWLASMYSKGADWPDDSGTAPRGSVVFLCSEDGLADTIRPRLDAHGADCGKVFVIQSARTTTFDRDGNPLHPDPADALPLHLRHDLPLLEEYVQRQGDVKLIVIDPVTEFLGRSDANSNAEVRSILSPLGQLAEKTGIAIVCVTHMNKSTQPGQPLMHRAIGSIAFTAQARLAYSFERGGDDAVIVRSVKNNLSMEQEGMSFRIVENRVEWDRFDLASPLIEGELISGGIDDATIRIWLEALLSEGPAELSVIRKQAKELRVSRNSLFRVKATLGIISQKGSYATHQGKWFWSLPEGERRVPKVREEEALPW